MRVTGIRITIEVIIMKNEIVGRENNRLRKEEIHLNLVPSNSSI